ncbi:hypothetical protein XELAEV_18020065mg [Xenopus laevis]|uniref:PB1 domain-containing protein n=1 Tax=Xenopus laevis TaxID=8355 RepID=A0A974D734_XENLA|nr:hypothetical protein XELAEV_18020065mg [Xenopus laevis]
MSSPCPAMLRVILGEHDIQKLLLPSGIPNTVDDLLSVIKQSFQLDGHLRLLYMDTDFGQFFTLNSAEDLKDKDSIKVVPVEEPSVILTLSPASGDFQQCSTDTQASDSSRDTVMLPPHQGRLEKWPDRFVPQFTFDVERILQTGNQAFFEDGTLLLNKGIKSDIMQKLAESIFKYTAYPTNLQILSVVEALIEKFPCLKEPGSFSGMYGWQQSFKYKMGNYRSKLRNQMLDFPELEVNSLKRKEPNDRVPSKNVKKPKKAELNYLPPHPHGESLESLENEQKALLDEIKKKDNRRVIAEKMSKTFSYRRHEVVNLAPPIKDFQQRWPALFNEAQAKTFMSKLDRYKPKLLELMKAKGGVAGLKMKTILNVLIQDDRIETRRDAVIRSLIVYLGEVAENLFKDSKDGNQEDFSNDVMKILVHGNGDEEPDVSIVIEGSKVLTKCANAAKACALLMGLIYALNLQYPSNLKYTFEVFQKLILDLDGLKLSHKVRSLKTKLHT